MQVKIRDLARERFADFLNACGEAYPNYIKSRFSKKISPIVAVIQMAVIFIGALLAVLYHKKSNHKFYVFQGARFPELHGLFSPKSVIIIGGIKEWRYAREKGYGFHWDGYIRKLFNIFYYLNFQMAFNLLYFIVRNLLGRPLAGQGKVFIFEDTVQIGVSLSLMLRDIMPVACIAHGYFARPNAGFRLVCDGDFSSYNFIYEENQKKYYYRDKDACFVLGLPYEIPQLVGVSKEIVLVEQSTSDMPEEYGKCMDAMYALASLLRALGYKYTYRPRPGSLDKRQERFESLSLGDKMELLGGSRKIFIGYNSTLLYEAGVVGHVTVGLDDSEFAYTRFFAVDYDIPKIEIGLVSAVIKDAFLLMETKCMRQNDSLEVRFSRCLSMMDDHNNSFG